MKKFMRALVLCCVLAAALSVTAWAAEAEPEAELAAANVTYAVEGGFLYFDATTGTIVDCDETVTSANIPASIYGIPVTKLGHESFMRCTMLTDVTIPDSVTSIETSVFPYCKALTSFTIPQNWKKIPSATFADCGLTQVFIPENITTIDGWAFNDCTALTDVYYAGTVQQWIAVKIETGNTPLITANIHFESEIPTPKSEQFRINSITVCSENGETLTAIPSGSFMATVSITSLSSLESSLIFFSAYTAEGQFQGLTYAFVEASPGATVRVTLPVDNSGGQIAQLKAFAVASFADMTPLGGAVSFPAA